ncbi:hypothetical protein D3C87_1512550 [compost metagenome]
MNGVPHRCLAIRKHHRHPAARFQHAVVFGEAALHQVLVVGQRLVLELVDDGFGFGVGGDAVPGLDQKVQVGVVDVFAERRVGEDVVNGAVRQRQTRRRASVDGCATGADFEVAEGFDQPVQLAAEVVPRAAFGVLRCDVVHAGQLAIHLRTARSALLNWLVAVENRQAPNCLLDHKK